MNDFFYVFLTHWVLSSLFILTLSILIIYELVHQKQGILTLSTQELTNWANRDGARLMDIRDPALFKKGHIAGSISVDPTSLEQVTASWQDKTQAVIVVCQSGTSSTKAANQLKNMGFSKVALLSGGIHTWQADHLPLVKRG